MVVHTTDVGSRAGGVAALLFVMIAGLIGVDITFTKAMDDHVKTEFPKLRDMLHQCATGSRLERIPRS